MSEHLQSTTESFLLSDSCLYFCSSRAFFEEPVSMVLSLWFLPASHEWTPLSATSKESALSDRRDLASWALPQPVEALILCFQ
jgi:hypothetical protein